MATPDVQQTRTMVAANGQAQAALVSNLIVLVQGMLLTFHDWYSDSAVADLADRIAQLVQPTQRVAASQADAFLAQIASASGRTFQPVGPVNVDGLRAGVTPQEVYQRLGEQYRYTASIGGDALHSTTVRAAVMNDTDVTLASRAQAQSFMQAHSITEYRRAVHPELARDGSCGMCIGAAAHPVPVGKPLALHGRCHCTEVPIIGSFDPAHGLNQADLTDMRSQGLSTDTQPYRIEHHGELGPVLTPKSQATRQA